jgi:hypothetical protein
MKQRAQGLQQPDSNRRPPGCDDSALAGGSALEGGGLAGDLWVLTRVAISADMRRLAGIVGVSGIPGVECLEPDGLRERLHDRVEQGPSLTRAATHHSSLRKRASPRVALPQGGDAPPHADLCPRPPPGPRDRRVREPGRWVRAEALEAERSSDAASDRARHILPARWRGIRRRQESLENAHYVGARVTLLLAVCFREAHRRPLAASNLRSRLSCRPRIWLRRRTMSITGTEPL